MLNQIWNKIVECYNCNINSPEKKIQSLWENIFAELLGYSRLNGEIDSYRSITIGSSERAIADIIIKSEEKDLFIVELKRENLVNCGERQLFSYLKLLHNDIGILISNKLFIYDYDYNKDDEEQIKIEIDFTIDNPDGIKFVELFSKKSFNKEEIKKFITKRNTFNNNILIIKSQLSPKFITDLIYDYFNQNYSEEEIKTALETSDITISNEKIKINTKATEIKEKSSTNTENISYSSIDHTKIESFNELILSKREKFINILKGLYPKLSDEYIKAYLEILTDDNGTIFDYDKLYKILITQYSSNRPPAPGWFAQKISEIVYDDKKVLLGIEDNTQIYLDISEFVRNCQIEMNQTKIPIAKIRTFCIEKGVVLGFQFKKWFTKLIDDLIHSNKFKDIICYNQRYVWLERNFNYKEESIESDN